jgi:hypothetical protein
MGLGFLDWGWACLGLFGDFLGDILLFEAKFFFLGYQGVFHLIKAMDIAWPFCFSGLHAFLTYAGGSTSWAWAWAS